MVWADETLLSSLFDSLNAQFHMKRIEPVCSYLGVEIERDFTGKQLLIHQRRYLQEVTELTSQGHARSPLTPRLQDEMEADEEPAVSETEYLSAVRKISYAACSTRPGLAYAHSWLAVGNKRRTFQMKQETERSFRYMRSTASYGLLYCGREAGLKLTMYVDASYRPDEYCPTGYVAVLGGAAVSWRARRQKQRSDSSFAAEFRAAKLAAKEVIWLRYLLEFLQCKQDAVTLACDSKSAIQLMKSVAVHGKS